MNVSQHRLRGLSANRFSVGFTHFWTRAFFLNRALAIDDDIHFSLIIGIPNLHFQTKR